MNNLSAFIANLIRAIVAFLARNAQRPDTPAMPRRNPNPPSSRQTKRTRKPYRKGTIAASAAALALAATTIGNYEGKRNVAYQDAVGVWTVCYGETRGVQPGDVYTDAQCDAMLAQAIGTFEAKLDACLKPPTALPVETKIALVSWAYNVGVGAACGSTLVKLANAGDYVGACEQLPRWNRAGGQVLNGLTKRRLSERTMCLRGLQ